MKRAKLQKGQETARTQGGQVKAARRIAVAVLVLAATAAAAVRTIPYASMQPLRETAKEIHETADTLERLNSSTMYDAAKIDATLTELKTLIDEYEQAMVSVESRYPGEVYLGTTTAGDTGWVELLCNSRYSGPFKEIRLRRTGRRAYYLRINDIEIYSGGPGPMKMELYNPAGRVQLFYGGLFQLALSKPTVVRRIRIKIKNESTGLEVYGIPYEPFSRPRPRGGVEAGHGSIGFRIGGRSATSSHTGEVLLGTTPPGDSTWIETICDGTMNAPIREIKLRRTGAKANYLRINDIELTYLTPAGPQKLTLNQNARAKLYRNDVFTLSLPNPMKVTHIRIRIDHESTGLQVYGVR